MRKRKERRAARGKKGTSRSSAGLLTGVMMLFFFSAFLLLALRDMSVRSFAMAVAVPAFLLLFVTLIPKVFPGDPLLFTITCFLCALGILLQYRLDPDTGLTQAYNFGVGAVVMIAAMLAIRHITSWKVLALPLALFSFGLLALPILFGAVKNGAKAWIALGSFNFQPSEIVKLSTILLAAYGLSRRSVVTVILFSGICLGFLFLQKDLGTAFLYYGTVLILIYAATGSTLLLSLGCAGAAAAGVAGYSMFSYVRKRVMVWIDAWSYRQNEGYQIVQGLIAMANGGAFGTGLGLGNASIIPEAENDYIFAVLFNEFGAIFAAIALLMFLALILRGIAIALRARTAFHALLALGCSMLLLLQVFVIVGGNINLIPLTGVTLPFLSQGGSSMVSSMGLVGMLQGVAGRNREDVRKDRELALAEEQ